MIKFPSIVQFKDVIKEIKGRATFIGRDPDGYPIFDDSKPLPVLDYVGTVKLHGSNSSVVIEPDNTVLVQSRNRVLTLGDDNYGFAKFVLQEVGEDYWQNLGKEIRQNYQASNDETIVIYGEWCGSGIQSGVAISKLEKMFVIFAIRVGKISEEVQDDGDNLMDFRWLDISSLQFNQSKISNICSYQNYTVQIDFNQPGAIRNDLVTITQNVEERCPVAFAHGVDGLGEGVVWRCVTPGYESSKFWFKVKGEEHSVTKVKTLASIDTEKISSLKEFVEATVTEQRLQQGIAYLSEMGNPISKQSTSAFLKWIFDDINKEEADTIEASSLTEKDLGKPISIKAREWFFRYLNQ